MTGRFPSLPAAAALDPYAQVRKTLSLRSPFDDDTEAARPSDLPAALAAFLSNGRHKPKKSHGNSAHKKFTGHGRHRPIPPPNVWDDTEEYFRPLTLTDIDALEPPKLSLAFDSCLSIPVLPKKALAFDAAAVEVSSGTPPPAAAKKAGELEKEEEEQIKKAGEPEKEDEEQIKKAGKLDTAEEERTTEEVTEEEESLSMNWLLGSTHRVMLTTIRPNKKHRLLGSDAGLDQLLRLPYPEAMASEQLCDVCCLGVNGLKWNQLIQCHSCKVSVHQKCYGTREVQAGPWLCSWCRHLEVIGKSAVKRDSRTCVLCPKEGGALKPVGRGAGEMLGSSDAMEFAHLFCSLWTPEVYVEDTGVMEPILNIGGVQEARRKLVCYLCKGRHGVCVRCSHGTCRTSFHPRCARESKHRMEIWGKLGFDNVELRAFCLKHTCSCEIDGPRQSESFGVSAASSVTKPSLGIPEKNQLSKLRFRQSNEDKSTIQGEITSFEEMDKSENTSRRDALTTRTNFGDGDTQLIKNSDNYGVSSCGSKITGSLDFALILRKLIDRGKITADDMATKIGISPNSLAAALSGETTSFSPQSRLKVINWLQDSMHIWKFTNDSAVSSDDVNVPDSITRGAISVTSLPPRTQTKSNARILKDNRTACSVAVIVGEQNVNVKLSDQNVEVPDIFAEDTKGDVGKEKSSLHDHGHRLKCQDILAMTLEGTANPIESTPYLNLSPGRNGNPLKMENIDSRVEQHQPLSVVENVFSFESSHQADEANTFNTSEKACLKEPEYDADMPVSVGNNKQISGQSCSSYVHLLIQRKLMQLQSYPISKHKCEEMHLNDLSGTLALPVEAGITLSADTDQLCYSSVTDVNHASGKRQINQLSQAKSTRFLELFSPMDELEGEMLYLQSRLLDKAVAIKHNCEDLILTVVRSLHQEFDALNRRKWDLILLHEVGEAKKHSRKGRRHNEAQSVLASAAAAPSRNSLLKRSADDEVVHNHQERPLEVSRVSGRAMATPLASPANVSSSAVTKVSSYEPSGIFKMPKFLQENLSCDICGRAESLLNRIFVCSSCKVAVHLDCYCKIKHPIIPWKCELCEEMASQSRSPRNEAVDGSQTIHIDANCSLCCGTTGAFRKSTDGQWVHAICAEWLMESRYRRGQQNPIEGMDTILKGSSAHTCCICHLKFGVCLKCSCRHCQVTFHPSCARTTGLYMNLKASGGRVQHRAYCEKHSLEQREADSLQQGAQELKAIKQIRVKLEKVRLLCERIIRREKLKGI